MRFRVQPMTTEYLTTGLLQGIPLLPVPCKEFLDFRSLTKERLSFGPLNRILQQPPLTQDTCTTGPSPRIRLQTHDFQKDMQHSVPWGGLRTISKNLADRSRELTLKCLCRRGASLESAPSSRAPRPHPRPGAWARTGRPHLRREMDAHHTAVTATHVVSEQKLGSAELSYLVSIYRSKRKTCY